MAAEVVHESLQGLVRQQLEMLVMALPGKVMCGLGFLALVINLPGREGARRFIERRCGGELARNAA